MIKTIKIANVDRSRLESIVNRMFTARYDLPMIHTSASMKNEEQKLWFDSWVAPDLLYLVKRFN